MSQRKSGGGTEFAEAMAEPGNRREEANTKPEYELMDAEREKILVKLTFEELEDVVRTLLNRVPRLVFDILDTFESRSDAWSPPNPDLPWCRCGKCREMPTEEERRCCGQEPEYCVSTLRHFSYLCLDEGVLMRDVRDQRAQFRNWQDGYRRAAYRRYTDSKYGPLGPGNRVAIPSCCVWRIRDKYPDPKGKLDLLVRSGCVVQVGDGHGGD
ncbi:hypothetical protein NFI96_004493 [Prochilodus magdalenae]|nr:hypothetical protein NFI96_004493 [Prochilodus magdalenae]